MRCLPPVPDASTSSTSFEAEEDREEDVSLASGEEEWVPGLDACEGDAYIQGIHDSSEVRLLQPERIRETYADASEYGLFGLFCPLTAIQLLRTITNTSSKH